MIVIRSAQNGKPGHTNLLSLVIHIELFPFTNKQTNRYTGYIYIDLSFLNYLPLSNLKLYLILVLVMFFYWSKSIKVI